MANEFIVRKGYIALENSQVTGSLSVTGNISASIFSGSFVGNGSQLTGVSAGFPFTGSAQITGSLGVTGSVTATSFFGNGSQLTGIDGFPFTGSAAISGSLIVVGPVNATSFTGSIQGTATTASYVQLANVDGFTAYSASINTTITPQTATVNTGSSPLTLTTQSIVIADSTNGNLIVNLPDLNTVVGTPNQKPIVVYKNDYSQNVIYVNPSGSQLVNGASQDIIVSIQLAVIYNPTSAGWVTEGTSAQSLAELELFFLSLTETGSLATTGSNVFIGNQIVTGSLTVTGNITGNITGSASTASYVEYTNVANKPTLVSGSAQITYSGLTGIPSGIVSGSSQVTYSGLTGIPSGIVSGSSQVTYSGLTGIPSGIVSGSSQVTYSGLSGIPSGIVSGSSQVASFGIFATTGSNGFNGSQSITGSLTVTGQVVAQTLNVQQVTSSIVYSSGSNVFGNTLGNTQQFTGSVSITGSLNTSIAAFGSAATVFLTSDSGTIKSRTAAQTLSDIAALPLAGGTLTGALNGTSAVFSGAVRVNGSYSYGSLSVLGTQGISWSSVGNDIAFGLATIGTATNGASLFIHTPAPVAGWTSGLGVDGTTDSSFLSTIQLTAYGLKFAGYNSKLVLRTSNGTSLTNALTLDGGNSGAATFSSSVTATSFSNAGLQASEVFNATKSNAGYFVGYFQNTSATGLGIYIQNGNDSNDCLRIGNAAGSANPIKLFGSGKAYFAGNVGIGTESPLGNLEVRAANRTVAQDGILQVTTTNSQAIDLGGSLTFGGMYQNSGTTPTEWAGISGRKENGTNSDYAGYLSLGTRPMGGVITERMRITSGGNVSIGNTNNTYKLDVTGQIKSTQYLIAPDGTNNVYNIVDATNTYAGLYTMQAGGGSAGYGGSISLFGHSHATKPGYVNIGISVGSNGKFTVTDQANASGTEIFVVQQNGNVGIGTASPGYRLDVQASVAGYVFQSYNTRNVSGDGNALFILGNNANNTSSYYLICGISGSGDKMYIYGNGNIVNTNNSYGALSDIKLKENITDASSKLDDLMKVKIRNYNLIGEDNKQIGVIAQELEEIFPSMIDESPDKDKDGNYLGTTTKSVKYSVFVPMLIKAFQEQQSQIEILKAEIQTLKQ